MLGLNRADASNEYSLRKYAPIRRRCVLFNSGCGSNASSISAARASKISRRFRWRPSKFSSTSLSCCEAALASSRRTLPTIWLARILSVGLRSLGSVAGLKGLTTILAGSGRRYKIWRCKNRDGYNPAPWGGSRCDRANGAACRLNMGFRSARRGSTLELPHLHKTEKIRKCRFCTLVLIGPIRVESVRTAARIGIDQCRVQVVSAQKPAQRAHRPCRPFDTFICPPRSKARGDRCGSLDGLLIKCFGSASEPAEALGSNWSEATR